MVTHWEHYNPNLPPDSSKEKASCLPAFSSHWLLGIYAPNCVGHPFFLTLIPQSTGVGTYKETLMNDHATNLSRVPA
jgi:hypothetical protein